MFESSSPQPNEHDHDLSDATISIRKAILYAESLWCTQRKTPTKNHRLPSCLFALHFKLSRKNRQPNDDDVVVSTPQRIMFTHDSKNNNNNNHKTDTSVLWPVLSVIPSSTAEDHYEIPIFDETISSSSSSSSPLVFRTQYLEPNQPCLLRGRQLLDKYFGSLHQQWRASEPETLVASSSSSSPPTVSSPSSSSTGKWGIHYDWFRQHVGAQQLVPLRVLESSKKKSPRRHKCYDDDPDDDDDDDTEALDGMGRAQECPTRHVAMDEWIRMMMITTLQQPPQSSSSSPVLLDQRSQKDSNTTSNAITSDNSFYLKDWHLQLHLEQQQEQSSHEQQQSEASTNSSSSAPAFTPPSGQIVPSSSSLLSLPLYQVPVHFEYDLLNHFLLRFGKSDYRFCYWGPRGSYTSWHTDVLHSYSWSYNVVGRKQWTFRVPQHAPQQQQQQQDDHELSHDETSPTTSPSEAVAEAASPPTCTTTTTTTIIQEAGDCIFVPSQWQHYVVNLEETLSVNHNWITTTNLPACCECLLQELHAVQEEMQAWQRDEEEFPNTNSIGTPSERPTSQQRKEASASNLWDWEAQENMLRGCVGLDVTSFLWMMVTRLVDLLVQEDDDEGIHQPSEEQQHCSSNEFGNETCDNQSMQSSCQEETMRTSQQQTFDKVPPKGQGEIVKESDHVEDDDDDDDDDEMQHYYHTLDVLRLTTMLQTVWTHPDVHADERMKAIVQCTDLSSRATHLIEDLLKYVLVAE